MENASKALLIAAAVLIVILIIAFGMNIFNSTGDTSGQVADQAASQQIQTFNAQFTGFVGTGRAGTTIRNLQIAVRNSNARYTQHQVTLTVPATLVDNATYTVKATYSTADDASFGYITAITVN